MESATQVQILDLFEFPFHYLPPAKARTVGQTDFLSQFRRRKTVQTNWTPLKKITTLSYPALQLMGWVNANWIIRDSNLVCGVHFLEQELLHHSWWKYWVNTYIYIYIYIYTLSVRSCSGFTILLFFLEKQRQ